MPHSTPPHQNSTKHRGHVKAVVQLCVAIWILTYVQSYIYICMYVSIYLSIYVCMYVCMYNMYIYIYMNIYIYIYIYIDIHIYIYIYLSIQICFWKIMTSSMIHQDPDRCKFFQRQGFHPSKHGDEPVSRKEHGPTWDTAPRLGAGFGKFMVISK